MYKEPNPIHIKFPASYIQLLQNRGPVGFPESTPVADSLGSLRERWLFFNLSLTRPPQCKRKIIVRLVCASQIISGLQNKNIPYFPTQYEQNYLFACQKRLWITKNPGSFCLRLKKIKTPLISFQISSLLDIWNPKNFPSLIPRGDSRLVLNGAIITPYKWPYNWVTGIISPYL